MFSSHLPTTDSHPIFSKLDSIARQTGLIKRHSHKFSAEGFLLSLLQCVTRGTCSLNQIAIALGGFVLRSMSRQALFNRFSPASTAFLIEVISAILKTQGKRVLEPLMNSRFIRILIEDSTVISMAKSNAEHFPNNGNRRGLTAGCKVNLVTDLISGQPVASQLQDARSPDQSLAFDILDHCRKDDLIIRDMGYFNLEAIQQIEQREAFWVSRLPASVSLIDVEGRSLESVLKRTSLDQLDMTVLVGSKCGHRCRLVATRLSTEDTQKNRRQRRRNAKKHDAIPSKKALFRDAWSLVITNVSKEDIPTSQLYEIYALRWSIEIQFRAFKQACRLGPSLNHRSDPLHIEALVLASMIFQLLTLTIHALCRSRATKGAEPSLEKLSDAYAAHLQSLSRQAAGCSFKPDSRHLAHDRRKRPTLWQSAIQSLG